LWQAYSLGLIQMLIGAVVRRHGGHCENVLLPDTGQEKPAGMHSHLFKRDGHTLVPRPAWTAVGHEHVNPLVASSRQTIDISNLIPLLVDDIHASGLPDLEFCLRRGLSLGRLRIIDTGLVLTSLTMNLHLLKGIMRLRRRPPPENVDESIALRPLLI
jgi:hypothetical protein